MVLMIQAKRFYWGVCLLLLMATIGCESQRVKQLKPELIRFGEHYRQLSSQRQGDIDWSIMQAHQADFPNLAALIQQETFLVEWFVDLENEKGELNQRVLAWDLFGAVGGGLVLFYDGSVRNVSEAELKKLRDVSEKLAEPKPVELARVSGRPYVETPVKGVSLALPEGYRWAPEINAYSYDALNGIIQVQEIEADYESVKSSVDIVLKRRNAGGVRRSPVSGSDGEYLECYLQSGEGGTFREKMASLILARGDRTIQVNASLPTDSTEFAAFKETVLGAQWQ